MNAMLVAARAAHFASAMLLFGGLVFVLLVVRPAPRDAGRALLGGNDNIYRWLLRVAGWSLGVSIVSGVAWLAAEAAAMSGAPLDQAIRRDILELVLGKTVFGRLWVLRFGVAVALGALLLATARAEGDKHRSRIATGALVVAAAYLATLALAGHAAAGQGPERNLRVLSDAIHLLAAGTWVGALPALASMLGSAQPIDAAARIARRFSSLGVVSVTALVLSGCLNSWYLVGDVPALIGTEYGRLLLVKLSLVAIMVTLAAINRLSLTPRVEGRSQSALRALRRNAVLEIAAGIGVVTVVGALGVTIPAAHQSPVWPFDHTLSWDPAQQSPGIRAAVVALGLLVGASACVALWGVLRKRAPLWITGSASIAAAAATGGWLLAVPAYPTTYVTSPAPYNADSIVRGAGLYRDGCSACHGADGHGDGPAAHSLSIRPADLAEHALHHRSGELFWWIAHGIPGTPMPGFAPQLSDANIWDLVQFLRAQAQAERAATLSGQAEPRTAIEAPDFTFEITGEGQASLKQRPAKGVTLVVLYTLPQSLPRLRELAGAEPGFAATGARVIAVPRGSSSTSVETETAKDGARMFATTHPNVAAAYAMFARHPPESGDAGAEHIEFLIDAQGYLRARWIGVPAAATGRTAEILHRIKQVNDEPQLAPPAEGHAH